MAFLLWTGYIFGAVDPSTGQSSALIAPTVSTDLMSHHLRMIGQEAGDDVHVVLVLDGAGWHRAKNLQVPESMTLHFLPPYYPELMPMERVWQTPSITRLTREISKAT